MQERLELLAGDTERDHARRVIVDHSLHVRSRLVDRAMDEALEVGRAAALVDRSAVERIFDDVVLLDALRRPRPRQQVMVGPLGMPRTHMSEGLDDPLARQDPVGGDQFFENEIKLAHCGNVSTYSSPTCGSLHSMIPKGGNRFPERILRSQMP